MTGQFLAGVVAALVLAVPGLAAADAAIDLRDDDVRVSGGGAASLPPYLQCVPYARRVSGIQIFGDAHTWWDQAAGRYERGYKPRVGAVMTFKPFGNMRLGHVAAVSRVVDSRTVLLRHSNWSPINGRRGQIEDDVRAIDVSESNDWSEVRVWFDPIQALGGTHWPVQGFIYNRPARRLDEGSVLARVSKRGGEAKAQLAKAERQKSPTRSPSSGYGRSADPIGEIIASRSRASTFAIRD
ncbi:MAG: CHAP domain-containing protein [Novosphingobium sp.]